MTLLQRICLALLLVTTLAVFAVGDNTRAAEEEVLKSIFDPARKYNKFVRPPGRKNATLSLFDLPYEIKGEPVIVRVNMFVRNIGEINDETKDYQVSLTLRQEWNDSRLSYTPNDPNLKYVTFTDASKIWVPDLFFSNEKTGQIHELMTPNALIRIQPRGEVLYSTRVSLKLSCAMDFTNFPMDKQRCSLRMASYAYTTSDLILIWRDDDPVQSAMNLDLAPYEMHGFGIDYCNSKTKTGEYSCLRGEFLFARMLSTWLMHAYLPLGLLVVVSWIIFWLDERAIALRVIVAVIVLVATAAEGARVSASAPPSGHAKAIDSWTSWTLFFVFLTLIEQTPLMESNGTEAITEADEKKEAAPAPPSAAPKPNLIKKWLSHYNSTGRRIDMVCRVLFPVVFLIFNLTYWATYADYEGLRTLSAIKKMPY
ncbi:hypothetical protein B566_EDAN005224 [Ephemera danica]|nr:hypothetical protein B566_EDAN005224 [Ephemera danica]